MARERIGISGESGTSSRFPSAVSATLTGTRTLTLAEVDRTNFWAFDPGGAARNLDLPAEESCDGTVLFIANKADAAEAITVRNDAAATVTVISQSESAIVWCDGAAWHALTGAVNS